MPGRGRGAGVEWLQLVDEGRAGKTGRSAGVEWLQLADEGRAGGKHVDTNTDTLPQAHATERRDIYLSCHSKYYFWSKTRIT